VLATACGLSAASPACCAAEAARAANNAAHTSRRPEKPDHVAGLAAYDAWADGLLIDADFPPDDRETLDIRTMVYGDQVCMVHDRAFGAQFLADCVPVAPEAAEPLKAAALTLARVPATPDLYPWQAMPQSELVRLSLASREVREDLVTRIRAARDCEAQALDHMAAALARLG